MIVKVGAVTIGQSPRIDIISEIKGLISRDINIKFIERGALDGLTLDEVRGFTPKDDKEVLVTRMQDGTEVMIGKSFILSRLQEKISELGAEDVELITLLCAGEFPGLRSERPLIMPNKLLYGVLSSISIRGKLGIMVPSGRQLPSMVKELQRLGFETIGVEASPYRKGEGIITGAAEELRGKVDLIVMNCFGYDLEMKRKVKEITEKPVILVRSLLAKTLEELIQ